MIDFKDKDVVITLKDIPEEGLPIKFRPKIPRQGMIEQDAKERSMNFLEVNEGYDADLARLEAIRCIECKDATCIPSCPVQIDIPTFVMQVARGEYMDAAKTILHDNALPAVCGRVCPQEKQCEWTCKLGKKWEPLAIGYLERFVADYARANGGIPIEKKHENTGKKVAIVGGGPSGLACAKDLAVEGHQVTIFEALHKVGGVLVYGIPSFRLPPDVVEYEVQGLRDIGVDIQTNICIGRTLTIDDLMDKEGFDAVFVGTGAGAPRFPGVPGENLNGIFSANEFLTRANLMQGYKFPEYDSPLFIGNKVAVIGGGNTAMDAVRVSKRLGAERAMIIYRRGYDEMPARREEIHHAEEEGIEIHFLTSPEKFIGDENGWVKSIECIKMELGEPDSSGRRRPIPIEGSNEIIDVDMVIFAIGTNANPVVAATTPGMEVNKWGYIEADEKTGQTTREGVFAGGDIVSGAATVILAMSAGRNAAQAINEYLGVQVSEPKLSEATA